jgi:xylulokinase
MPLVAGVDSSTSGCKVEVRDVDSGALVGSGRAEHPATTPPCSEQDPKVWRDAFERAGAQAGIFDRNAPAAIAVAAQQHGLVVSGRDGEVLRPAKLWNDTESAPDADALVAALDGGAAGWAAACGSVPVPAFTITKLAWLRRREPDTFRQISRVQLPHDWLTAQLTNGFTTDRGDVSGTGWWSPAEERYRTDLLALVDDAMPWDTMLPEVLAPMAAAGTWAATDALVAPGTGDNMGAALGLGLRPGDLVLSFGTSGTAFCVSEQPSADPSGAVAGFADATGRYLPLVCTLNATKVLDAVSRLLGIGVAGLDPLVLASPPGAGGLVLVPHLDGERTPNRPDATGSLTGLRSDVTREQLARAAVEGVVCNLLDGADRLRDVAGVTRDGRVIVIGGGARSRSVRQVVADLTGRPVVVPDDDELVARGAAVQAASVLTGQSFDEIADGWSLDDGAVAEPSPGVDRDAIRAAYRGAVR